MAILKATILTKVNQITSRAETDIDAEIIESLIEISRRTGCLKTRLDSTIADTTLGYFTKPTDLIGEMIDALYVEERYDSITLAELLNKTHSGYVVYGTRIYYYPIPPSTSAYSLYYRKVHASTADTIELPDEYYPALYHYVASKVYEKYEINDQQKNQLDLYEIELAKVTPVDAVVCTARQSGRL